MSANWEKRCLTSWGSNVRLDINNPTTTLGGNDIYAFYGVTNEDEDTNVFGLQENGIWKLYNDRTVEIVGGQKGTESGVDIIIHGKNGDVCINADRNGRVRIRGKNVIVQADEDIDMIAGRNITLKSGSGRILLKGNTVEEEGLKGNLLPDEMQWAWRVFEGTGLPGSAFGALIPGFGGIADLAGNLLTNPASFATDFVGGAIDSAVSSATGGLVSNVTGAVTGGDLGGAVGGIVGSAANSAVSSATGGVVKNVTNFIPNSD